MKTTTTLPDLAQSFGKLKTLIDLENKVTTETIFGYAIKKAFIDKEPNDEIIEMIKDQLRDNKNAVQNCIPNWIIEDIGKYWPDTDPNDLQDINI